MGRRPARRSAALICDIYSPDGTPFAGGPRAALKRVDRAGRRMGYTMNAGMEAEFFMFKTRDGEPTTETHDVGGYFDLAPVDLGEEARRAIVHELEAMGFEVEAAHHEVAQGQHEIDFRYADALTTADNIATFRFVVKDVARDSGCRVVHAEADLRQNGAGCTRTSRCSRRKATRSGTRSAVGVEQAWPALHRRTAAARAGFCAITNPLVNSYKRLVPGYEAPVNVAWSEQNRSPLMRVPERRGAARAWSSACPTRRQSVSRAGGDAARRARRHRHDADPRAA